MLAELRSAEERGWVQHGGVTWESPTVPEQTSRGQRGCHGRDEMGKGVRGQIIMDFVFLPKSWRFIVASVENS